MQTPAHTFSDRALTLLKSFEQGPKGGFASTPYRCPANVLTIGYGHAIRKHESFPDPISEAAAEKLLRSDVGTAEIVVNAQVRIPLSQAQFDALVLFSFNVGVGAFEKSTLRKLINNQADITAINKEWKKWVHANEQRLNGLVIRRTIENMMYNGADDVAITTERHRLDRLARQGYKL